MKKRRIALFGGSFNPVHIGHLEVAQATLATGVDELIVMPCNLSPHKVDRQDIPPISNEHRWNMLREAFQDIPRVQLSRFEIDGPLRSFSDRTIKRYKEINPNADLILVIGFDQYAVLNQWHNFHQWSHTLQYMVFERGPIHEKAPALPEELNNLNVQLMTQKIADISSTKIRNHVSQGISISGMVPKKVEDYIRRHHLYEGQ